MKCKICGREAQVKPGSKYCEHHLKAYENLQKKFEVWRNACAIGWHSYLNEVAGNPFTGVWAKEVAMDMLSDESSEGEKEHLNGHQRNSIIQHKAS